MSGDLDAISCALWGRGAPPQNAVGLLLALVNLVVHVPFTDLPVLRDYELGQLREQYDYVIVGGGSAGCVIANRLSADPHVTVLLLEAGGLETASRQLPATASTNTGGHDDWAYWSRLYLPRGKVLGGTSTINLLMYVRGHPYDFDRWAREYGAKGWAYEEVLPHFKDIEDYRAETPDEYHGTGGEVPIDYANTSTRLGRLLLEACNQSGYPYVDYNGRTQSVQGNRLYFWALVVNLYSSHLSLSLCLSLNPQVIIEGRRAVGVALTRYGQPQRVSAAREVILSAGTVGSAQLLMLSGIGPREDLERLQIPVVADLPVGRTLQEHVTMELAVPVSTDVAAGIQPSTLDDITQYATNRSGEDASSFSMACIIVDREKLQYEHFYMLVPGPISMPQTEVLQFLKTNYAADTGIPDIEIAANSNPPATELLRTSLLNLGLLPEAYDSFLGPRNGQPGFLGVVLLNRPKSRGTLRLRSTDPNDHPDIDPSILEHPDDVRAAVQGMYLTSFPLVLRQGTKIFIDKMLSTDAMKSIGAKPWDVTFPPCAEVGPRWSPEYIECMFRHLAHAGWHMCCTVPMGSHPEAVLDERLRVRGNVKGLRVADASVMPDIVSGHTHAPSMMIGNKAAAMIVEDDGTFQS
ncbi:oxygen-dependent choline dehydrogenase [Dermacentor silvarum]|uniref:oxygen-dependent choline dehydrogenase n=1 Tax=Dermacentor silvarum TaxID=543639 RepID=UPI0021019D67|nr:oxygen-dependent choline dehydrogenase [Dermacentor silvarum]